MDGELPDALKGALMKVNISEHHHQRNWNGQVTFFHLVVLPLFVPDLMASLCHGFHSWYVPTTGASSSIIKKSWRILATPSRRMAGPLQSPGILLQGTAP
jgi:hypothetical protein